MVTTLVDATTRRKWLVRRLIDRRVVFTVRGGASRYVCKGFATRGERKMV